MGVQGGAGIANTALTGTASSPPHHTSTGSYELSSAGSASPTSYFARPATPQKSFSALRQSSPNKTAMNDAASPFKTLRHPRPPSHLSTNSYAVARSLGPNDLQVVLDLPILSSAQKELAVRVHNAAQRLRDLCREVDEWTWSGRWEDFSSHVEHDETAPLGNGNDDDDTATGGVKYRLANRFERIDDRLQNISENLARLEVEELKEQVLCIHLARSRPGSGYSVQSLTPGKLELYNEFELFVTQAIIQALPQLEVLRQALRTWSMRLLVLKELPRYLADLRISQSRMWAGNANLEEDANRNSSAELVDTLEVNLRSSLEYFENIIPDLGTRLDGMLDALEGGEDEGTFPNHWIDDFEALERDYGVYAAEAQRKLFEVQLLQWVISKGSESSASSDGKRAENVVSTARAIAPTVAGAQELQGKLGSQIDSATDPEAAHVELSVDAEPTGNNVLMVPTNIIRAEANSHQIDGSHDGPSAVNASALATDGIQEQVDHQSSDDNAAAAFGCPADETRGILENKLRREPSTFDPHSAMIRRASVASVESIKRGQVKKLNIKRSSGLSAMPGGNSMDGDSAIPSLPSTPLNRREASWCSQASSTSSVGVLNDELDPLPVDSVAPHDNRDAEATFSSSVRRESMSSISSLQFEPSSPSERLDSSPTAPMEQIVSKVPKPPLNGMMQKKRQNLSRVQPPSTSTLWADAEVRSFTTKRLTGSPTTTSKPPENLAVPLQQQISEIITTIPASIRLVSSPSSASSTQTSTNGSPSPTATPPNSIKVHKRKSSLQEALARSRSFTPTNKLLPALILAPADEATSKRSGPNDPEIKLYHLTQPGAAKPIKLFIRRVGENSERVMVRVGGGWADLGEYLRAFVEHHSHVVSSGSASVVPMSDSEPGSGGKRKFSFPSTSNSSSRSGTPVPDSFLSRPIGTSTPRLSSEDMVALATLPLYTTAGATATSVPSSPLEPNALSGGSSSRKISSSTREAATIGLAGPARRTKVHDMSDEKREWVDGIVEQARRTVSSTTGSSSTSGATAAAGKGEPDEKRAPSRLGGSYKKMELGTLGEAGKAGNKRVFLRSKT